MIAWDEHTRSPAKSPGLPKRDTQRHGADLWPSRSERGRNPLEPLRCHPERMALARESSYITSVARLHSSMDSAAKKSGPETPRAIAGQCLRACFALRPWLHSDQHAYVAACVNVVLAAGEYAAELGPPAQKSAAASRFAIRPLPSGEPTSPARCRRHSRGFHTWMQQRFSTTSNVVSFCPLPS
jgi:hypothetical protein